MDDDGINIKLSFDTPFIRADNTISCTDGSSSIACGSVVSTTSTLIDSIVITGLCSSGCTSGTGYTIKLVDVVNYLEVYTVSGTISVTVTTDSAADIAATSTGYALSNGITSALEPN